MNLRWIGALLVVVSVATGCGDDDDGGGGGGDSCAKVQELCDGDANVEIDCDQWDKAPEAVRNCAVEADECGDVAACFLQGAGS